MADLNHIPELYADFHRFMRTVETREFYTFFKDSIESSPHTLTAFEKYVERRVDVRWIEAMESTIIPFDTIIRNPSSYIKREEDIIPIALARGIGPESIRHLAQHTSMIQSVEGDTVMPNKILNITKEDSIDTYENRFIYTLLDLSAYFLDKRVSGLLKDSKVPDLYEYQLDGNCPVGPDEVTYHFNMHIESPHEEVEEEELINADVSLMSPLQRIERLRKIFYTFQRSAFYKALAGTPHVRPPLVMTNKLKKNPDFMKAVSLWNFINSYHEVGYTVEYVEQYRTPSEDEKNELFALTMLEYVVMKKQCGASSALYGDENFQKPNEATAAIAKPQTPEDLADKGSDVAAAEMISRTIEDLCTAFNMTIDEVRRVYEKEIGKRQKKRDAELAKARGIFERAIAFETRNNRRAEEKMRERIASELKNRYCLAVADEISLLAEELRQAEEALLLVAEKRRAEEARLLAEEERRKAEEALLAAQNREEEEEFSFSDTGVRYRYSFAARLVQNAGEGNLQSFYAEIKNHLLSYEKVRSSMAWGHESFRYGRSSFAKIKGRGKTLQLYLAVDPDRFADTKYHVEDMRTEDTQPQFATRFRVRSDRGVKYAKELIDDLMSLLGAVRSDEFEPTDYRYRTLRLDELLHTDPPFVRVSGEPAGEKTERTIADVLNDLLIGNEETLSEETISAEEETPDENEILLTEEEQSVLEEEETLREEESTFSEDVPGVETEVVSEEASEEDTAITSETEEPSEEYEEYEETEDSETPETVEGPGKKNRRKRNYKGMGRKKKKAEQKKDGVFEIYKRKNAAKRMEVESEYEE